MTDYLDGKTVDLEFNETCGNLNNMSTPLSITF